MLKRDDVSYDNNNNYYYNYYYKIYKAHKFKHIRVRRSGECREMHTNVHGDVASAISLTEQTIFISIVSKVSQTGENLMKLCEIVTSVWNTQQ